MSNKIIHKHSSVVTNNQPKIPTESQLEYGEIAVNYADGYETISIKNSNNGIVTFKTSEYNDEKYAPKTHEHPEYATVDHKHVSTAITDSISAVTSTMTAETKLVQGRAVVNYAAPKSHASTSKTYGEATTSKYGHVKISNGDVATVASADGLAAGMDHSHSNYSTTGHTHDEYVSKEYVDGVIEENELVIAGALNELNDSLTLKSDTDHNHSGVYSEVGHKHNASDITGGTLNIAHIPTGTTSSSVAIGNHKHVSSAVTDSVSAVTSAMTAETKLVQGRAVVNYAAPKSHASSSTTYGVATTSNYGHVKISNGDVASVASANGLVAGMDHSHSNYSTTGHTHDEYLITPIVGSYSVSSFTDTSMIASKVAGEQGVELIIGAVLTFVNATDGAVIITNGYSITIEADQDYTYLVNTSDNVIIKPSESLSFTIREENLLSPVKATFAPSIANITATSTTGNYPLIFGTSTTAGGALSTGNRTLYMDNANNIHYNPSTNTLTVANIVGTASSATTATSAASATTASSATTATNANNVKINVASSNANYPIILGPSTTANGAISTGNKALYTDSANNMYYNPSSNTLTVAYINGLASSATTATSAVSAESAASATTANSANTLNTLSTINGVNYTGAADVSNYVTCSNAGSTTAKTVTHSSFKLVTGARVSVKFSNDQASATSGTTVPITLQVGNTTAKGMYYKGNAINGTNLIFKSGIIYDFVYDGSNWCLQGEWKISGEPITSGGINGVTYDGHTDIKFFGICSSNSTTSAKVVTLEGYTPTAGSKIFITFTNGSTLPNTATTSVNMFLNVNGSGNKEVYFEGQKNIPYLVANEIYEFMYDGTRFNLVNMSNPTFTYNTGATPVFEMSTAVPNALHLLGPTAGCRMVTINNSGTMVANKSYNFEFTLLSSPGNITLPTAWKWVNGTYPVFEGSKTYQISVMNNCAVCASFSSAEPS